jgi:hypothetical protein
MCADERIQLESCCAPNIGKEATSAALVNSNQDNSSSSSSSSSNNTGLAPAGAAGGAAGGAPPAAEQDYTSANSRVPAACEGLQKAFLACVADRTTPEEILDYREKAKEVGFRCELRGGHFENSIKAPSCFRVCIRFDCFLFTPELLS